MSTTKSDWQRVSKARRCPVCDKPDWCLYSGPTDAPTAAICARTESHKRAGEAGWLHKLRDADDWRRVRTVYTKADEKAIRDFGGFARQCHLATCPDALQRFGESLGLSRESLARLLVGWSRRRQGWCFPMTNAAGEVVGIRLRLTSGRKLAIQGGTEGLFIPSGVEPGSRLLVCEGPTDTAALLDLGFSAVGRPSCTGGGKHLCELVKRLQPEDVVIVADGDGPGQRGADNVASVLVAYCTAIWVIAPPCGTKDARQWLNAGATAADVQDTIDAAEPRRLRVTTTKKGRRYEARAKQTR